LSSDKGILQKMSKTVYFEPGWKFHSSYRSLIENPPEGYTFKVGLGLSNQFFKVISTVNLPYVVQQKFLSKWIPVNIVKSRFDRLKRIPHDIDLTYSSGHLVFRKEPWVVDMEYISLLTGYNVANWRKYKSTIENTLASEYCKKIICWSEAGAKTVLLSLNNPVLEKKLAIVPRVPNQRIFTKSFNADKVRLLFVNSNNIPGQFYYKGGLNVLEAFDVLRKKYNNLELTMRSDMPKYLKDKSRGVKAVRIIDKVIPWEEMEKAFMSADIFLFPAHCSQDLVVLDAMSYELPVVISDLMANPEVVEDGKTGFVIGRSMKINYFLDNGIPSSGTPAFEKAIRTIDSEMIERIVQKTSLLIEDENLRRRMGKAGRWEVDHGKFSIKSRNEKLKGIFDEATN
jgi:glycosyltransferase involved in cell wall biosynthesis